MNTLRNTATFFCCLTLTAGLGRAALPIDLEVATEPGVSVTAPQAWARVLGQMDLGSVRLREARGGERPELETRTLGKSTRYHLLAILSRRNELLLPDRRFKEHERRAMKKYFEELPVQAAHNSEQRGLFGLTEKQFRQIYTELSIPVGFSTKGLTAGEVASRLFKTLSVPIAGENKQTSNTAARLSVELRNFSTGTVLAYALRCDGMALRPLQRPGEKLQLMVVSAESTQETWPIGWKPGASARQAAPQLYKSRNVELNNFTLAQALTALQPALKVPVVIDHWILAQKQIDPSKIPVSVPRKKTFLKAVISKILSQGRLAEEVRVDELEQPFLWITRFGKHSPPASK